MCTVEIFFFIFYIWTSNLEYFNLIMFLYTDPYRDVCLSGTLSNILQDLVLQFFIIIATLHEQCGVEIQISECLVELNGYL
jgi:hypothetical protein